jgi:putative nucleotidyltransferase with HDIG domain
MTFFLEYGYNHGSTVNPSRTVDEKGYASSMVIPVRTQCLALMERVEMPPHIRRHSMMVAEIALYLGRLLNKNSVRLDLDLLEAGALLHDIGKMRSIATGERHDTLGAKMLDQWGYQQLTPIVQEHASMDVARLHGPITESLVVNYADKRVKHDQIVTIQERFEDLIVRYGKTEQHRIRLREKLDEYLMLEGRLFEHLTISPIEVELMNLSVDV